MKTELPASVPVTGSKPVGKRTIRKRLRLCFSVDETDALAR